MEVTKKHNLTRDEAKEKVEKFLPFLKRRYGQFVCNVSSSWKEDIMEFSFTAQGFNITGNVQVTEVDTTVFLDIPFLLKLLEGKILSTIEGTLDDIFPKMPDQREDYP